MTKARLGWLLGVLAIGLLSGCSLYSGPPEDGRWPANDHGQPN